MKGKSRALNVISGIVNGIFICLLVCAVSGIYYNTSPILYICLFIIDISITILNYKLTKK